MKRLVSGLIGLLIVGNLLRLGINLRNRGGDAKVDAGTVSSVIKQDVNPMQWIAWSPDGQRLATCADHGDVHIWTLRGKDNQIAKDRYVMAVLGPSDNPSGIAWLNDGNRLAKICAQGGLSVINVPSGDAGETTKVYDGEELRGNGLAACPSTNSLVWANSSKVVRFDLDKKISISFDGNQEAEINCIACQPTGSRILTVSANGKWAIWDFDNRSIIKEDEGYSQSISCCWSPDGKFFATGSPDGHATGSGDASIKVWTESGESSKVIGKGETLTTVTGLSWSPDGKLLASCHVDKSVYVWDWATGQRIARGSGFGTKEPYSIAWRPNSRSIAVGTDGVVWLWDLP